MKSIGNKLTIRDRVMAVLKGEKPDRLPFIDRLELWYTSHSRKDALPAELKGMSLTELHQSVGIGQQKFLAPYSLRLRSVEIVSSFQGETVYHEIDPVVESFPTLSELVKKDKVGVTAIKLVTPIGALTLRHQVLEYMVATGAYPYLIEHLLKGESDYRILEYILERAEYVAQYERLQEEQTEIGDTGFVVPLVTRIPFQQILIDYLGEVPLFYGLYDNLSFIQRLMRLLDQQLIDILNRLADLAVPYIEFPDNLHGLMTNPRLFREYCLPYYQRYVEILHGHGKKVGSHTDGNVKSLLSLLAESNLDVCESFSPTPLTECTFEEAWRAWREGPIIWGGIPSPILEERTSESEFRKYLEQLLQIIGCGPIILGVGDLVMSNNLIERVRYIATRIEEHALDV